MFSFIYHWFIGSAPAAAEVPLEIPPGMQVMVRPQNLVGTVSALVEDEEGTRARVVFTGARRTWVEQVSLHRIVL